MLSHSPPLPLIINYDLERLLSANEEEGILLALQKHNRVRRFRLCAPTSTALDKFLAVMNGSFPLLDHLGLCIEHSNPDWYENKGDRVDLSRLPQSFQAPRLRQLDLRWVGHVTEVRLPLLATLTHLAYLALAITPTSRYLLPDYLTSCLTLIPRLMHLDLTFELYIPSDDVAWGLIYSPNMKRIALSNLTRFFFEGLSSYLEALAAQISAPHITTFKATFLDRPSSTLPHLSGLLTAAVGLRFPVARIRFPSTCVRNPKLSRVTIRMASSEQTLGCWPHFPSFRMVFPSESPYTHAIYTGLICAVLTPVLSAVERLHLCFKGVCCMPPQKYHVEDARWHDLLRPFCKVKKLWVDSGLWVLSRALSPYENGPSMEILSELRKILRPDGRRFGAAFDEFIAARRDAGQRIVKRWHTPVLYSDDEGSEGEEHEDESESHGEEDEEQEDNERVVALGFEDERGEAAEGRSNVDTKSDIDYETDDDPGILTEIDSDSDFYSESKS